MTEKKGPAAHIDQAREAACSRLLPESRTLNQQTWKLGNLEAWKLAEHESLSPPQPIQEPEIEIPSPLSWRFEIPGWLMAGCSAA